MADSAIRWGIIGPGKIASSVVGDFEHVPGAELVGVASRSLDRAQAFAAAHGIARSFGSYAEIIADDDIDVLYIATPHTHHHAIGLAAVRAGKAILVEKAFTATMAGATELVNEARERQVFAMEAMWTRFQPAVVRARELIAEGAIGEVRSVQADLGVAREYRPADRSFAFELGGGALLDLGVYVVSFAQMLLGTPTTVHAKGMLEPTGVDAAATLLLGFGAGKTAALMCDLHSPTPGQARIFGTTGWIDVLPRFHHPDTLVLHRQSAEPESMRRTPLGRGYAHEFIEVTECLRAGRIESSIMPLEDTLAVQAVLDEALRQLGIEFTESPNAMLAEGQN
ncbi:Gfo/Idh/MocA family protein [Jatrophihabitans sp. DSM 45814]